jgi:dipeptidyl aminopeptidase/acylaminoacyl peptidase
MKHNRVYGGAAVAAAVLMALSNTAHAAPPVSAFTNFSQIESLKVSPGGKYLALTKHTEDYELMTVLTYPDAKVSMSAPFGDQLEIDHFEWVSDSRLLIQPARRFVGYTAYKAPTGEIIGLDINNGKSDLLFSYRKGTEYTDSVFKPRTVGNTYAEIVDLTPDDPDTVLIQTRAYDREGTSSSLQRMNVKSGRLARIAGSPVQNADYITSTKHEPLFVNGLTEKGEFQSYLFNPADRTWKLLSSKNRTEGTIWPFRETSNPNEFLAIDSLTTPRSSVIAWNPTTDERRVLFQSDFGDVNPAGVDANGRVWIYSYDDHTPKYWYPDPEHPLARAHRALSEGFKDANVTFTSHTNDMSLVVAQINAPRIPPTFYLIDVKTPRILQRLPGRPDLKSEDLSPTDPIELTVRDGMKIRGFLTTPKGSTGKSMPMIVVVHGGPHGPYDRYGFDPEVQLFASRGYAVLQVNFRGSGGRGREFERSGFGKWGREMQNDITDAVKWSIAAGLADRNRICIYGASYGAYAALTGVYREPDMFKCAIGMAGVYDLPLMFEKGDIKDLDRGVRYLKEAVGTDENDMRQRSPVYNADKIKAAVMLIHGRDDERAPFEHALRMRAALQKAGQQPEWISEGRERHGIFNEASRAEVYEQMLAFFAKHLSAAPVVAGK